MSDIPSPISATEKYLSKMAGSYSGDLPSPVSRDEIFMYYAAINSGGGGEGTTDYTQLENKPSINGVTLTGNKTTSDLNLSTDLSNYYTKPQTDAKIAEKVAEIVADAPEDFDTLKEMSDWIDSHEDSAAAMNSAIQANTTAIAKKPGEIVTGKQYIIDGKTVVAGAEAEVFNSITYNRASGAYSHAEGCGTTASGDNSHAEGGGTTASGVYSHAEGCGTTASGVYSHTEGVGTKASGKYGHAEGSGTKASSNNQHVQGRYNVEDSNGKYAFIIGNGTSSAPHNAFAIDWSGLIYVNGASTGVDVNSMWQAVEGKVDKVSGKGLSTEDYTPTEKTKLADLENYDDTAITSRVSALEATVGDINSVLEEAL